jgi:hypothetical protein
MPVDDKDIPTVRHRYTPESSGLVERPKSEPFLKGPISLDWISRIAQMPGKALNVALAIRWLSDMSDDRPIKLTKIAMQKFNFSKDAANDAIKIMERENFIKVLRPPGQKALIEKSTKW